MRVLHVTLRLGPAAGGVASYVGNLTTRLGEADIAPTLVSTDDQPLIPAVNNLTWHHYPPRGYAELGYAPKLFKKLDSLIQRTDIVHLHGLRTLLGRQTRIIAQKYNKPLVISPHAQLTPWLLSQRKLKKTIINKLWLNKSLRAAHSFLAVSPAEAEDIREHFSQAVTAAIPIGIDPDDFPPHPDRIDLEHAHPQLKSKRIFTYCAIMMPRKGIFDLISAWGALHKQFPDWHLVIAGPPYHNNQHQIEQKLQAADLQNCTTLVGFVQSQTKQQLFASSELTILPTHSESFAISIGESLAAGTPVLTTTASPWPDLELQRCGWRTPVGAEPITYALREALCLPAEQLADMGQRGRQLICEKYTWDHTIQQVAAYYNWVAGRAEKPPFVRGV